MNRFYFVLLLLSSPTLLQPLSHASSSPPLKLNLNLQDAIRYAADHAPGLAIERMNEEIRNLEHLNAKAKLLPSLDVSAVHGVQGISPEISQSPTRPFTSSVTVSATESLYDNGESLTRLSIAALNKELARLSTLRKREALTLEISREFYRYSLNHQLIEVEQQQLIAIQKQFTKLEHEYRQGFKTKQDYLRLKAQSQRAVLDLVSAKSRREQSAISLRKLLGMMPDERPTLEFQPQTPGAKPLLTESSPNLKNTYLYRMQELENQISDKTADLSRRNYWPQAFLTSGVNYQYRDYLRAPTGYASGSTNWNVMLTLQYNFWDWGIRKRNVLIAEDKTANDRQGRKAELIQQQASIMALAEEMQRLNESFTLQQELLVMEEESYSRLSNDYRDGKISYLDLVSGMDNMFRARVNYYTLYFSLLEREAEYRTYEGTLYETLARQ
ncbi:MAG TPA: hypothetical protein DCS07_08980 [Bdellovibrionales bacterium]|nr:MAG: hypothetical protein A2Z97_04715 [Bdellovibrionales bacterium GWB1_52_6]OFZ05556.1 MAG: hypothetical protein A2X97_11855 [Bdellovibrionales bacterium GWA1_52_35]HAR42744.1 hypothetical protein [Bdellovibrionales bacterium]HCM39072.1 hypothetical protein [Bdellovibrionales bacterium]